MSAPASATESPELVIDGRRIGDGQPVYVVAEVSANHNQRFDEAARLVRAAKEAGADAVKLQTYTADTLTLRSDEAPFRIGKGTLWEGKTLHALYDEAYTPWEWQPRLQTLARELGLHLFSTPFDASAVDFLEDMNVPAYKIASFELVDLALIERVARTKKPLILSTGMATRDEIADAVATARGAGATQIALLKCTSAYPAEPRDMNLRSIEALAREFHVVAGLSNHTLGIEAAVVATALGARIIEKHLTMSRAVSGPDSAFSLEPHELAAMIAAVRLADASLGTVRFGPTEAEEPSLAFRRSLFVVDDIAAGELVTENNVRSIRPSHGLAPKHLPTILGRRATRAAARGTPVSWALVGLAGPPEDAR